MSIRVMIVEDEPPISRVIHKMIHDCDGEFFVCHAAKNGAEAEAYLQETLVDVIFTDIRMPVVDGLALLESVHKKHPNIFIVVLSGYQDFEYAKHALINDAFDYLLKPITFDAMSNILAKLKAAYHQRNRREKTVDLLTTLQQLNRNKSTGMLHTETYLVMLICAGAAPLFDSEELLLPGFAFWDVFEMPFLNHDKNWLFAGRSPSERILLCEITDSSCIEKSASEIFSAVCGTDSIPITVLYLNQLISFSDVRATIRLLLRCLPGEQQLGTSLIVSLNPATKLPKAALFPAVDICPALKDPAHSLADSLIHEKKELITRHLAYCLGVLKEKKSSYISIFAFFDYVLFRYEKAKPLPLDLRIFVYEAVYPALSYEELQQNLLNTFEILQMERGTPKAPEFVYRVKEYLEKSYHKPITGMDLSQQFGFVPSYISRIFREHFGYSPAHYITMLRIGEAKRLLHAHPALLVKEVALMVGYKDQYYFSKAFKKEVGLWPSDFKI